MYFILLGYFMKTRIIQTRFWEDDIVQAVSSNARLLWICLLTNKELGMTNFIHIPDVFLSYYTGLSPQVLQNTKEELQKTGKIFFYGSWIYIPKLEDLNAYKNAPRNIDTYNRELSQVPNDITMKFKELYTTIDTSMDSTMHSTHKSKILNKKSKNKNTKYGKLECLQSDEVIDLLKGEFPNADVIKELRKMILYCQSNGKTYKNYLAFARHWLLRDTK